MTSSSGSGSGSDEVYLNELVRELTTDLPTIDASIKNLVSLLLTDQNALSVMGQATVLACARVLLQCVQSWELPDMETFAMRHPQLEGQSADDRLTEICKYKVIYFYRLSLRAKGEKLTRCVGRNYFFWTKTSESIRQDALHAMQRKGISEEAAKLFLDKYFSALLHPERDCSDADLIWAANFSVALRERQERRSRNVETRIDELTTSILRDDPEASDQDREEADAL